jgi:benzylsuccinate CoA-transferase BbsF subunit
VHFIAPAILEYQLLGSVCSRQGNRHPTAAPHNVFPCREPDSWCAISVYDDAEWERLTVAMRSPGWARSPLFATRLGRKENEADLHSHLAEWTRTQDAAQLMCNLQKSGVHAAKVNNAAELFDDPQLQHRHFWGEVFQKEVGRHHTESPAFDLSLTPHEQPEPDPLLNEHTDAVLSHLLKLTPEQLDSLAREGAIERPASPVMNHA